MFNQFKSDNLKPNTKLFYEIIKNSLEYYDDYKFNNMKKQVKIASYNINKNNDAVKLYDKNNKLLYDGKFQIIFTLNYPKNIIKWSYENSYYNKISYYSKQISEWIFHLDTKYDYLRELLIESKILEDKYDISTYIKISIIYYLLKKPNFFYIKTKINNNEYYDYICLTDKVDF